MTKWNSSFPLAFCSSTWFANHSILFYLVKPTNTHCGYTADHLALMRFCDAKPHGLSLNEALAHLPPSLPSLAILQLTWHKLLCFSLIVFLFLLLSHSLKVALFKLESHHLSVYLCQLNGFPYILSPPPAQSITFLFVASIFICHRPCLYLCHLISNVTFFPCGFLVLSLFVSLSLVLSSCACAHDLDGFQVFSFLWIQITFLKWKWDLS